MNRPLRGSGSVRIIGGSLRRSRLLVPESPGLRPSPDRVRETLFNWLAPVLPGSRCLDLFSGTGALGIEAMSRGAGEAIFLEHNARLVMALRKNLARLHIANTHAQVIHTDALDWLQCPSRQFDVVFVDPPYASALWSRVLQCLSPWLAVGARVYVEWPKQLDLTIPYGLKPLRQVHAGEVSCVLLQSTQAPE